MGKYLKQHLDAYETEDDAKTVFQIGKVLGYGCQGKVEGAQSQDGKDIRGEYNERVAADGEHGRYAIHGERYVGGLYHQQGNKKWCCQALTVLYDEELVFLHLIRHGEEFLEKPHKDVFRGIDLLVVMMAEHLNTCIDQEESKDCQYPLEPCYHGRSGKDKDAPEYQCTEYTPEEYLVLVFPLDAEEREKHQEDK